MKSMTYASGWARKLAMTTNPKRQRQIMEAMRKRCANELAQDLAKKAEEDSRKREMARAESRAEALTMDNL